MLGSNGAEGVVCPLSCRRNGAGRSCKWHLLKTAVRRWSHAQLYTSQPLPPARVHGILRET